MSGGGKGGGGDAPPPPDPAATAQAQAAANKQTAIAQARLNQVNEFSPWGSAVYDPTGETRDGIEMYKRTVTLDPAEQGLLEQQRGIGQSLYGIGADQLERIGLNFGEPIDFSGLPDAPNLETGAASRSAVEDALFSRLEPQFDRDREQLRTQLVNSGFNESDEGYIRAMDEFNRAKTDARYQAVLAGSGEQSRVYGLQGLTRDRALSDLLLDRNTPLNELTALLGVSPGVTAPQFGPVPQTGISPTDVIGPTYQSYNADLLSYENQQNRDARARGGLYGLGGAVLGSALSASSKPWIFGSDRRIKRNLRPIGRLANGLTVYVYRYIWGGPERIGLVAQEVLRVRPEAVVPLGAYLGVDYRLAME